ncbi:hypothetical protein pipiens_011387 [Culex pipiens pipiens]|uniref:Uncharacterized protein n=1 Tax=Culex pipiens pipiens TaxID=38569 RepID=A0ABD1D727_CULPP
MSQNEVTMNGSDRRSINSNSGMNGKSTNSETPNSSVSQQLQEIYAKLRKLDDLEKLSKDLVGKLVDVNEVTMNGSDRRSINSNSGMNGKSTNSETPNSSVSQQLQEIYAKLR